MVFFYGDPVLFCCRMSSSPSEDTNPSDRKSRALEEIINRRLNKWGQENDHVELQAMVFAMDLVSARLVDMFLPAFCATGRKDKGTHEG